MSEETTPSAKVAGIIETISGLTVLELAELVKALEVKFGVSAAAPMMMVGVAPSAAEAAPVKDTFDVILTAAGEKKIQVIKVVREITSLGLKEAKALVDEAPKPIKEGVSKQEADDIQARMVEAGATIEIK
ncbi:MAG: 50S ribosomal protein L7/L12 [Candidatus Latescibacteria bacterium]|nr:50S ribosomal protein L7/L12 [Candidatus Latescibacterota bacterium]